MDKDSSARLAELESQLAFQEDTIQTLNDIVTRQEQLIERLTVRLEQLFGQVQDLGRTIGVHEADNKPPPHY